MSDDNKIKQAADENGARASLKLLLEFGPLLLFLLSFWQFGIFTATKVFMVAVVIALGASRLIFGKVAVMPVVVAIFVMFFGGLTIWFDNDVFIKLKPTIVNVFFSAMLLGGLAFGRPLLKLVFEEAFQLTEQGWQLLTRRWAIFFLFLAGLNEIVWRNFSTSAWVAFKTFGLIILTMVFAGMQIGLITRFSLKPPPETTGERSELPE